VQNGAYFLTRAAFLFILDANNKDKTAEIAKAANLPPPLEDPPQDPILDTDENFQEYRSRYTVVVDENLITLDSGNSVGTVFQFARHGNYYVGKINRMHIFFSLEGIKLNYLFANTGGLHTREIQLELDASVVFADDQIEQIPAPNDFSEGWALFWRLENLSLGSMVEIRRAGSQNFVSVIGGVRSADWAELDLKRGTNTVRVTYLGGPFLHEGQIKRIANSPSATYNVVVTQIKTHVATTPHNFRLYYGDWLQWDVDGMFWVERRLDIRRAGHSNFEFVDYSSGGILVSTLNLNIGNNILRVTNQPSIVESADFEKGILTITNPSSATITLVKNAEGHVSIFM
jgi:hypothetical protein